MEAKVCGKGEGKKEQGVFRCNGGLFLGESEVTGWII